MQERSSGPLRAFWHSNSDEGAQAHSRHSRDAVHPGTHTRVLSPSTFRISSPLCTLLSGAKDSDIDASRAASTSAAAAAAAAAFSSSVLSSECSSGAGVHFRWP